MLWSSNELEELYKPIVANLESESILCKVVDIRIWHLPVTKYHIKYRTAVKRKMNILEEFVIRASLLNIDELMDISSIAETLGLDFIFVDSCVKNLINNGILTTNKFAKIQLTDKGKSLYQNKIVTVNEREESLNFYFDYSFGAIYSQIHKDSRIAVFRKSSSLENGINKTNMKIDKGFINNVLREEGRDNKIIPENRFVAEITDKKSVGNTQTLFCEVWLYDYNKKEISCRVWDYAKGSFRFDISNYIKSSIMKSEATIYENKVLAGEQNEILRIFYEQRINNAKKGSDSCLVTSYKSFEIEPIITSFIINAKDHIAIYSLESLDVLNEKYIDLVKQCRKKNVHLYFIIYSSEISEKFIEKQKQILDLLNTKKSDQGNSIVHFTYTKTKMSGRIIIDDTVLFIEAPTIFNKNEGNNVDYCLIYKITDKKIIKRQNDLLLK